MFNPSEASKKIKEEFIDYITTTFSISDNEYNEQFRKKLLEKNIISKGPLIDIKDVFKSGKSINDLINDGILSSLFLDLEKNKPTGDIYKKRLPLSRPLYVHQEKAIDVISVNGKNSVITTGTGSGKTECFLIPVINELLRQKEKGTLNPGVRAMLIYPMNALANDQMKRLRELLMYYPDITFGVYNGETKYSEKDAVEAYNNLHYNEACEELRTHLPNELISREVMNATPPHILCTNYAMLEHMLLRPENDKIFKNSDFKFIVLDEAHIYTGATGMETSLLLRRLKARIHSNDKIQFILTSATLGKENESKEPILNFAENLCGEKFEEDSIVFGKREAYIPIKEVTNVPAKFFVEIASVDQSEYKNIFDKYAIEYNDKFDVNSNLYEVCYHSSFYERIRENTSEPEDITTFSRKLDISEDETVAFIYVCTLAYKDGKALIDAKYHFFIKALEGLYTPLYGNKVVFLDRKDNYFINNENIPVFERTVCSNCGELGIVGKIERKGADSFLVQASQYEKGTSYFHIEKNEEGEFIEIDDDDSDFDDNEEDEIVPKKEKIYKQYYLCPKCGCISEKDDGKPRCKCDAPLLIVSRYEGDKNANDKCLNCQSGKYRRFYLGNEASTGVIATSLFEELPSKKILNIDEYGNEITFNGGKQFLIFSDSRSEAAYFASYMDKTYKEFLRRRAVVSVLEEHKQDFLEEPPIISELVDEVKEIFIKNKTFIDDLAENPRRRELDKSATRNAWIAVLSEFISFRRRSSLQSFGLLKFEYIGNEAIIVDIMSKKYNLDKDLCKNLLDYLALMIAQFGALKLDNDPLLPDDRKYIFFTDKQKIIVKQKTSTTDRYSMSWMARNREGKADSYYLNIRAELVCNVLRCDYSKANCFLEDYFDNWLINKSKNRYALERNDSGGYYFDVDNFIVRVQGDKNAKWYKCTKCGKITTFSAQGHCPEHNCHGDLIDVTGMDETKNNHFLSLYEKKEFNPLLIKEHTAQLSREEGLEYQKLFEKNRIHALSCSTTFEMGVDVGELETVFLRNVPPTAANYAQRAGRAGRSKNSAAYSLTYAKLSSHDFNYYNDPKKIITGKIKPPKFKIDNEKIVLRHIYAVVLSYFFQNSEIDYFNNNDASLFLESGGYEELVKMINDDPYDLKSILSASIPNYEKYNWKENLIGSKGILSSAIYEYRETISELEKDYENYYASKDLRNAQRIERMIKRFKTNKMIDFLVRCNVLPKYGFPIDSVELDVTTDENKKTGLNLSRDLKMAISEYAPGEKIIADGKMYTSRYIKKSFFKNTMDFYTSYVCQCDVCKTWNFSRTNPKDKKRKRNCVTCHTSISPNKWFEAIEPRNGFVSQYKPEEVPLSRPEKVYRSQDSYIGDGKNIDEYHYLINGREVLIRSSENDEIMVTSFSKFYVCKKCGCAYGPHDTLYTSDSTTKRKDIKATKELRGNAVPLIKPKGTHNDSRGVLCSGDTLYPYYMNHVYKTDVIIIDFCDNPLITQGTALSVLYALLNAMSDEMGIDINDISGTLSGSIGRGIDIDMSVSGYSLVLYDTVAGGAGHVGRLKADPEMLKKVILSAYNRMINCNCDSSCYNCLRSYSNQRIHDKLFRKLAADYLYQYIGEVKPFVPSNKKKNILLNVSFTRHGAEIKTETYSYIFSECPEEYKQNIIDTFDGNKLVKPDLNDEDLLIPGYENVYVNYVWIDKKVMLFFADNRYSYDIVSKTEYKCFILDSKFKLGDLLDALA